jgi:hypothetical protein
MKNGIECKWGMKEHTDIYSSPGSHIKVIICLACRNNRRKKKCGYFCLGSFFEKAHMINQGDGRLIVKET